jgi:tRNA(Ile2) C34 agmatinyltransferase TiaS
MSKSSPLVPDTPESPACPECSTTMDLANVTQGSGGIEERTYQCPKCGHSMVWVSKPL